MSVLIEMIATGPPIHLGIVAGISAILVTAFAHLAAGKGW